MQKSFDPTTILISRDLHLMLTQTTGTGRSAPTSADFLLLCYFPLILVLEKWEKETAA
jgi:hypothetical protein